METKSVSSGKTGLSGQPLLPKETFFLNQDEAEMAASFVVRDPEFFTRRPAFGNAGGPDVLELTDKGREYAFRLACSSRFALTIDHIRALELIHGFGADGIGVDKVSPQQYSYANALDFSVHSENAQATLAASLNGDQETYAAIRDRNQLIWNDGSSWPPRFKITGLGSDLLQSAAAVGKAMLKKFEQNAVH